MLIALLVARFLDNALSPNNEINIWFAADDPSLQLYYEFINEFGNDRIIFLSFKEDNGLIEPNTLHKIQSLTEKLQLVEGVKKVWSITNVKDVRRIKKNSAYEIEFTSYFDNGIPSSTKTLSEYKESILSSPLLVNRFINHSGEVGMIVVELDTLEDIDNKRNILIEHINRISINSLGAENVHLGGMDIVAYSLNKLTRQDVKLFLGMTYIFIFLLILFFFPRVLYVILVFATTVTATIITLSIYGFLGYRLNILTIIIPTLVIILGFIIVLHIINEFELIYQDKKADVKRSEAVMQALVNISIPCLFATLTTMIGFLSLFSSSTSVIKEFGVFAALGTLLAFISAFIYSVLLLTFIKPTSLRFNPKTYIANTLVKLLDQLFKHPKTYWSIIILFVLISAYGITQINIDMNPMGYFSQDSKVMKDHRFISENWGGDSFPIDLMVVTKGNHSLKEPNIIKAIYDFEQESSKLQEIRSTFSFVHFIQRYSRVLYKKGLLATLYDPFLVDPLLKNLTTRMIEDEDSESFVNKSLTKARINVLMGSNMSIRNLEKSLKKISDIGAKHFQDIADLTIPGYPALFIKVMDYAFGSMKNSLLVAFFLIFFSMLLLLRSFKLAFIALLPNIFPILLFLGFLGFSQINLDLTTSTIAAIILGIAIDDTIYFLNRYLRERNNSLNLYNALKKAHYQVGRIIVISSIILLLGFSVLLFASIKTVFYFGLLLTFSVLAILIGDLIMLPLLIKSLDDHTCESDQFTANKN